MNRRAVAEIVAVFSVQTVTVPDAVWVLGSRSILSLGGTR